MKKKGKLYRNFSLFVVFLFFVSAYLPLISASQQVISSSQPLMAGSTLYVGGDSQNNYTRIQDAIDAASEGDTIFVFDDSSPYIENLFLSKKGLKLLGENPATTIIDGNESGSVIFVATANQVVIDGFTIQNVESGDSELANILLFMSDGCIISNNIVRNAFGSNGIFIVTSFFNTIQNNLFSDCGSCIEISDSCHNSILINTFENELGNDGIIVSSSDDNIIKGNIMQGPSWGIYGVGIWVFGSSDNVITRNSISNHSHPVYLYENVEGGLRNYRNKIIENNFINYEKIMILYEIGMGFCFPAMENNLWDGNYWDEQRTNPKWIPTRKALNIPIIYFIVPWYLCILLPVFDMNPVQQPYDVL